jgi:hypothetical protein
MAKYINYKEPFHWLLLFLILAFILFKMEAMQLPFFWDEAWAYLPAIRTMAEGNPSLMPGSFDPELYRGHPLLFYYLSSLWIKFLGHSLPIIHLFPLFISIALLLSTYFITYRFTNSFFSAFLASLILAIQPIFLTQSTFLLMEVLLALLVVWSFWFYFTKRWVAFIIFVSLALWTKESAYCLLPTFFLAAILEWYYKKITTKHFLIIFSKLAIAFLIGFSFFISQKIKLGWYFFPLHTGMINFNDFGDKLLGCIKIFFIEQGRIYFVILAIGLVFYQFKFNNLKYINVLKIELIAFAIFFIFFAVFTSINFFSARYLFTVIPLIAIMLSVLIGNCYKIVITCFILLFIAILGLFLINNSIKSKRILDVELSYISFLKAQVKLTNYIVSINSVKGKTYAPFLMFVNLTNPYAGFVNNGLKNITLNINDSNNIYYINSPNETSKELDSMITNNKIHLIKLFEFEQVKLELYKK